MTIRRPLVALVGVVCAAALAGCASHARADPAPPVPRDTTEPTGPALLSYKDASFVVVSAGGAPGQTVDCRHIDYPFAVQGATRTIHWYAAPDDTAHGVTTSPPDGLLDPGTSAVVHVVGSWDGGPGAGFRVTVTSPQARGTSYTIDLTCR